MIAEKLHKSILRKLPEVRKPLNIGTEEPISSFSLAAYRLAVAWFRSAGILFAAAVGKSLVP